MNREEDKPRGRIREAWTELNGNKGKPPRNGKQNGQPAADQGGADLPADGRRASYVTNREHLVTDDAVSLLHDVPGLYQRGGRLVQFVCRDGGPEGDAQQGAGPRIEPVLPAAIRELLTAHLDFKEMRGQAEARHWASIHPPDWLVPEVIARRQWFGVPELLAVVNHPVFVAGGRLIVKSGYDAASGLFLVDNGPALKIAPSPTEAQVRAAVSLLLALIKQFPFLDHADRSAWLAALLTLLVRFAIPGPVPMFLSDGNMPGVGKGLLWWLIHIIIYGTDPPTATFTRERREMQKRILAMAIAGQRFALLDNIDEELDNAALAAAITATYTEDRSLGKNLMAQVPLHMTWFATGNNVQLSREMERRVLPIRLRSTEEQPETRTDFDIKDIIGHVREHRKEYLAAALTIAQSWYAAKCPVMEMEPFGSFTGWSAVMRNMLMSTGLPDPILTRKTLKSKALADDRLVGMLMEYMLELDPKGKGLTASYIMEVAEGSARGVRLGKHHDLHSVLDMLLPKMSSRCLGKLLSAKQDHPIGKRRIVACGESHQAVLWKVENL